MNLSEASHASGNIGLRSLLTFAMIGGFATGLQYVLMLALICLTGVSAVIASGIGFVVSAVANYLLNARFTFRTGARHASAVPKFIATAAAGLLINSLLLMLMTSLGLHLVLAQILTTLGVLSWNYLLNALWTFRHRSN
jgi:putative flippase GtrA